MFSIMTPIPEPVQRLLDLFSASLADVRFPDVDAQALARAAAEVTESAAAVDAASAALDDARAALALRQDTLLRQAQRAVAYARVYAENDDALSAQLEAITLPRAPRKPKADLPAEASEPPRRRGRPRATPEEQTTLTPSNAAE